MLKSDLAIIFIVLLLSTNDEIPPYIANLLAFMAGLCIKTLPEYLDGKIRGKDLAKRLFIYIGLIIGFYLLWEDRKIKTKFWYAVIAITLFGELIRFLILKYGAKYINQKAEDLDNG